MAKEAEAKICGTLIFFVVPSGSVMVDVPCVAVALPILLIVSERYWSYVFWASTIVFS